MPAGFRWNTAYEGIKLHGEMDAVRGDIYAVAASDAALGAITRAVMDAHSMHVVRISNSPLINVPNVLEKLRNMRSSAMSSRDRPRVEAIQRSLDDIYRLTHAKATELECRRDEFRSASPSRAVPVPDPESLGRWLRSQRDAASGTDIEHAYFAHLARELHSGRDPWTVSREFMGNQPGPGDAQQADRLQAAHIRLVRAMARGLSERPPVSAGPEPPSDFRWQISHQTIVAFSRRDASGSDFYAAIASASALREIDLAVMDAYLKHRMRSARLKSFDTTDLMEKLLVMRTKARRSPEKSRADAIQRSLDDINRLTHARHAELMLRSIEFRSASHAAGAPVPDTEALGRWLRAQADAARGTGMQHSYFTQLEQELAGRRDPWTVSREFIGRLPSPGDPEQTQRLQAAHGRLVQAMAGSLPLEAAVLTPIITLPSGESRAPASMQHEITGRLNRRHPLSEGQVQAILSAVGRAIVAGELGVSTSRPEAWARSLVGRVQASVQRPTCELTEPEWEQESSDLERLGKLVEELGGPGYL